MSQLVESREELDESERDPGHRLSDRLGKSASGLDKSGLNKKNPNHGGCDLFKEHYIPTLASLLPFWDPETLNREWESLEAIWSLDKGVLWRDIED